MGSLRLVLLAFGMLGVLWKQDRAVRMHAWNQPSRVATMADLAQRTNLLPAWMRPETERSVWDDFENGDSPEMLRVGGREVHLVEPGLTIRCADRILVRGMRVGEEIAPSLVDLTTAPRTASSCSSIGVQRVAIILVNFPRQALPSGRPDPNGRHRRRGYQRRPDAVHPVDLRLTRQLRRFGHDRLPQ